MLPGVHPQILTHAHLMNVPDFFIAGQVSNEAPGAIPFSECSALASSAMLCSALQEPSMSVLLSGRAVAEPCALDTDSTRLRVYAASSSITLHECLAELVGGCVRQTSCHQGASGVLCRCTIAQHVCTAHAATEHSRTSQQTCGVKIPGTWGPHPQKGRACFTVVPHAEVWGTGCGLADSHMTWVCLCGQALAFSILANESLVHPSTK